MAEHADFEHGSVTEAERRGFWSVFVIMMGFTFFSASMWVGVKLANGLSFGQFVWAVMASNVILSLYCSLLAWQAAKTGLSVHLLSRYSFGLRGSYIPSSVLAFTQIGWFGVGVAMFSIPTTVFLKDLACLQGGWLMSGATVDVFGAAARPVRCLYILTGVSGLLMTSSAYFGIRALRIISLIAVPSIAVFGGWSALKALFFDDPAFIVQNNAALAGRTISSGWQALVNHVPAVDPKTGASAAMVYGKQDISEVLKLQGLLLPAIVVLGLNIWTTNDNALYTSGLGISNITGLPKRWLVLFNGLLGTAAAIWLYDNFCGWLNILNTVIPPCGAIIMADFFLVKKRVYAPIAEATFAPVSLPAVAAWALGSTVALAGFNYIPLGSWAQAGIPAVNGMLVAAVVYVALQKLLKRG